MTSGHLDDEFDTPEAAIDAMIAASPEVQIRGPVELPGHGVIVGPIATYGGSVTRLLAPGIGPVWSAIPVAFK